LLAGLLLVAYLVAGQPLVGRWSHRRFAARLHRDPQARVHRYRRTAVLEWSLVGAALLLTAAAPGLTARQLGIRPPGLSGGAAAFTVVGLAGLLATLLIFRAVRARLAARHEAARHAVDPEIAPVAPEAVLVLLPRTVRERRAFTLLALTAGVCEEVLYRGLFLAVCVALVPGLGPVRAVFASGLAFGLAHLYQGPWGMLGTGVLGGCLTVLYLGSGSLLLPVCYHALLDLRVLLLPPTGNYGGGRGARHRA
jgi:membrane protease YdiL (CAAX protease family)